ncbi:hypothetical protein K7395_15440 [Streptomyces filamentosus]|uniref:Transposase n=2 Tax=Streptomyces filamentosus TaxID=67294 RepID=A0ABY4UUW7_STRFL|nr:MULTISPECIES: hypothetical protein [Streptomyces]EFE76459.1 transposase [Streptomyces filamentosus NRRL 15998]MYR80438.1 hypothetical protein [Streptomyces sp. SID5466]USC48041.1 hypothetical protein K7395_15440 [Streptomyces filamentosus]
MAGVITASEPSWTVPFTGLSPRGFGKLMTMVRHEVADEPRRGRPWSLSPEGRAPPVAAYWHPNLTPRRLTSLFGVSQSAADRIIDRLGPADGVPGTGLVIPQRRAKGQAELPDWKREHNRSHKYVRARVEHAFARAKGWKILRACRLKSDGVHHAMLGIARPHNLTPAG